MVFSSAIFLFIFLPVTLFLYFVVTPKLKNLCLLFASLFFYAWGEPKNIVLMLLSIAVNYGLALVISRWSRNLMFKRIVLALSVVFNLSLLFVFKYYDFFVSNLNSLFGLSLSLKHIALPIGISFFTFQSMSYVIDVYREDVPAQKNPLNLGLYISFFPQLIAGPIVRYIDIENQINSRTITVEKFHEGVIRFITGFSKKVLIADQLAIYVNPIFEQNGISFASAWFGIIAYSLQIYFDFSGYSDMAIGLGKMFGFDFNENFNYPYVSKSIKEFWRRWHISLSTWFRDYVYIPLGGSRCSKGRAYTNLVIIFFLTGFWHGASWNFIVWGLYYAVFLVLERLFLGKLLEKTPAALQHVYAIIVIIFGWVFFRAVDLSSAMHYIQSMFTFRADTFIDLVYMTDRRAYFCMIMGLVLSAPVGKILGAKICAKASLVWDLVLIVIFFIAISYLLGSGFSPFLYFRF